MLLLDYQYLIPQPVLQKEIFCGDLQYTEYACFWFLRYQLLHIPTASLVFVWHYLTLDYVVHNIWNTFDSIFFISIHVDPVSWLTC